MNDDHLYAVADHSINDIVVVLHLPHHRAGVKSCLSSKIFL